MQRARLSFARLKDASDLSTLVDTADIADATYSAEVAESLDAATQRRLHEVEKALGRIETAGYGICDVCGESIDAKRLEARPWAARCLQCQQNTEQGARSSKARLPEAA